MEASGRVSSRDELRVRVADPQILSEIVEGEAVVLDLRSGCYFSLDPVASAIWAQVVAETSIADIVAPMQSTHEVDEVTAREAVDGFVARLRAEGLVVDAPLSPGHAALATGGPAAVATGDRAPFTPPVLTRYDDVQDLLLLDPIHDVDESGWPAARVPQAAAE